MRYVIIAALALLLAPVFTRCAGFARMEMRNGRYEGAGQGWRGPVRVRIRIDGQRIAELEILEHSDDPATGGAAMEELADLVLEYQTTNLDAVSGATESGAGFLAAVEDACGKARQPNQAAPENGE